MGSYVIHAYHEAQENDQHYRYSYDKTAPDSTHHLLPTDTTRPVLIVPRAHPS